MTQPEHFNLRIRCDERPFLAALRSLEEFAKRFPDVVERFLKGLPDLSELIWLNSISSTADGTNEVRVVLEPSDCFRQFLAAFSTRDIE